MHPLRRRTLPHNDPALTLRGHAGDAREILAAFEAPDGVQSLERARMLSFLDEHADALERTCAPGHLTASALLFDAAGERALLTLHAKLGCWLQLGGHCDGDGNLRAVALRELQEESGIEQLALYPHPVDVDIHVIPARKNEPEHLHLDTRFVAFAPEGAREVVSSESLDLRWFTAAEARQIQTDDSVLRLFERFAGLAPA